ncbi:MAG: thioredoxin family protein [Chloroflexi bacterium]|nr:thioredoxin family protein [Chloroflexota bacterium]
MTQQKESVVTPERFAQGQPYDEWIKGIDRNLERFQENYEGTHISDEDAAALKALVARPNGPARCLALGEAWCPDVFRGLPVMARIAEVSGMELRVFFRDQNNDIMAEFLKHGEHESIPTLVFYTKEHEYIAHWIERPAKANEEMSKLQELTAPLRNADITPEEREKHIKAYVEFQQGPIWAGWRDAAVSEIRQLLEDKVS